MRRLRTVALGVVAWPGRVIRSLRSLCARTRQLPLKIAGVGLAVLLSFALYQGWSMLSKLQNISPGDPLVAFPPPAAADSGANAIEADGLSAATGSSGEDRASLRVHELGPPSPQEPRAAKSTWLLDELVQPVPADEVLPPGWRRDGTTSFWYYETAVILRARPGSPVVAAGPGVVMTVAPASTGGWDVVVQHDDDLVTLYGNVFHVAVAPGDMVSGHARLGSVEAPSNRDAASSSEVLPSISFAARRKREALDVLALLTN